MNWIIGKKFIWNIGQNINGEDNPEFGHVYAQIISQTQMMEERKYKNGKIEHRILEKEKYNLELLEKAEVK